MTRRLAFFLAALLALGGLVGLGATASQSADDYWPGLPVVQYAPDYPLPKTDLDNINRNSWQNAALNGRAGSVVAKQWTRLSVGVIAANIVFASCASDGEEQLTCRQRNGHRVQTGSTFYVNAFFVSPDGSPAPYGYSPVTRVRTVAFGSIPVEVDLQIRQLRDRDGLPEPISARLYDGVECIGECSLPPDDVRFIDPGTLSGSVRLAVVGLRVDGRPVGLGRTCATRPTSLALRSGTYEATQDFENNPTYEYDYNPRRVAAGLYGGGFNGDVDIPAFSGCSTSTGDDVSPLLTSALSADGNPVRAVYGQGLCFTKQTPDFAFQPSSPGENTPAKARCPQYNISPSNPLLWVVPLPQPLPTVAPGEEGQDDN